MRGFIQAELAVSIGVLIAGMAVGGWTGHKLTADHYEAKVLESERAANAVYRQEIERGDTLAAKLEQTEAQLLTHATEVIRYVPQVTTGRKCLDDAAVRLLNGEPAPKLSTTAGKPDAEGAGQASAVDASDADVAYWIAAANRHYEVCAGRLNGLIEYEEGRP